MTNVFHAGDGRLNQLGGMYVSGKPLPVELRSQIISLSCLGVRQCDISRQLKVTHGCVSKLLSKYQETGNVDPSQHAGRPKVITAEIERKIDEYRKKDPGAFCWELRQHLLRDNVCAVEDVPSLSSISRLVKNKIIHEGSEHSQSGSKEYIKNGNSRQSLTPFSIASILDMNNDDKKDSTKQQCTRNLLLSSGNLSLFLQGDWGVSVNICQVKLMVLTRQDYWCHIKKKLILIGKSYKVSIQSFVVPGETE